MNTTTTISSASIQNQVTEPQQQKTLKQTVFECANLVLSHYQQKLEGQFYQVMLRAVELPLLMVMLEEYRGNQTRVAKVLNMSRGTLRKKLNYFGLNKHSKPEPLKPTNPIETALMPMHESVLRNIHNYLVNMRGQTVTDLYPMVLAEVDEPILSAVMAEVRNNRTRAAKLMGISRGTMHKKLRLCGLEF